MGKLGRWIPAPLRTALRQAARRAQNLTTRRRSRETLQDFWRTAHEAGNRPEDYIDGADRSRFLVKLVSGLPERPRSILEIGCNVGRNLQYLHEAGLTGLEGLEINPEAAALMKQTYPELAREARIHIGAAEDILPSLPDRRYDLVFSMAVLEHIHNESQWIFEHIARLAGRNVLTIEDEECVSSRHFPRNYKRVFEQCGLRQLTQTDASQVPGLGPGFVGRLFARP